MHIPVILSYQTSMYVVKFPFYAKKVEFDLAVTFDFDFARSNSVRFRLKFTRVIFLGKRTTKKKVGKIYDLRGI